MVNEVDHKAVFERFLSRPILVPLSGTDVAEGIFPFISDIARKADVPLALLGVVDPEGAKEVEALRDLTGAQHLDDESVAAKTRATDHLKRVASDLEQQGIRASVHTTFGNPSEEILRVAEEKQCGLIAMSTHGRNALTRGILGSVTDRVVNHATLPVLALTPQRARKYREAEGAELKTVILPLDGSELAERARPYVVKLARALSLDVLLVRVVELEYPSYGTGWYMDMPGLNNRLEPQATKYLDSVAQLFQWRGLKVSTRVLRGSATQALLSFAQETPNSMLAMTTHGRSGASRWLMGSVSDAMLRASGDPVLIIPSNLRPKVNAMEAQALALAVNA